jgi:hypothetical protein
MSIYLHVDVQEYPCICIYACTSRYKSIKYVCTYVCIHVGTYVGLCMCYIAWRLLDYNGI